MSCHKYCDNCEYVFCELSIFAVIGINFLTENHEPCPIFFKDPFHEFRSKAAQAVFSGNHHFFDSFRVYSFQKGNKTLALLLEIFDLSFKVVSLMFWTDSGVVDLCLLRKLRLLVVSRLVGVLD